MRREPGGTLMAQGRHTLMDPPIEELLDKVDSKFTLVALGSARARQVNSYYNSLGEGLGKVVPPQVASGRWASTCSAPWTSISSSTSAPGGGSGTGVPIR